MQRAIDKLNFAISNKYMVDAIDQRLRMRDGGINTLPEWREDLQNFVHLIDQASQALLSKSVPKGSRPKLHIRSAAHRYAALWKNLSGEDFVKSLTPMANEPSAQDFASPSAQFVWKMMVGMDPTLRFVEVRTALANIDLERLRVSFLE